MTLLDKITADFNTKALTSALTAIIILCSACTGDIEQAAPTIVGDSQTKIKINTGATTDSGGSDITIIENPTATATRKKPATQPSGVKSPTTVSLPLQDSLKQYIPTPPDRDLPALANRLIKIYV